MASPPPLFLLLLLPLLLFPLLHAKVGAPLPLPAYMKKCPSPVPAELSACVVARAKEVLPHMIKGDRRYGIPPMEPVRLERLELRAGPLRIAFSNASLAGCSAGVVTGADINLQERRYSIDFFLPKIDIRAHYRTDGRILVIPVQGEGDAHLVLDNLKGTFKGRQRVYTKDDGVEYVEGVDPEVTLNATKATFRFDNLFNGNELLGNATNAFLNENWQDVFEETRESMEEAIGAVFTSIINGLCRVVPFWEIYPR